MPVSRIEVTADGLGSIEASATGMKARWFLLLALTPAALATPPSDSFSEADLTARKMDALRVESAYNPKLSFGISLKVLKDNDTNRIYSIEISKVRSGSYAEEQGVKPMTKIHRIDGKPVQYIVASFLPGSELGRVFVNRKPGDKVALEVTVPNSSVPHTITLIEQRRVELPPLPSRR